MHKTYFNSYWLFSSYFSIFFNSSPAEYYISSSSLYIFWLMPSKKRKELYSYKSKDERSSSEREFYEYPSKYLRNR